MHHPDRQPDDQVPPALLETARAIDRLARSDAADAPRDLHARLARASWPALQSPLQDAPTRRHRRRLPTRRTAVAIAAGLGIVATVALTWVAASSGTPSGPMDDATRFASEFDLLLTLTADVGDVRTEMDLLFADTAAIEAELESGIDPWTLLDMEDAL